MNRPFQSPAASPDTHRPPSGIAGAHRGEAPASPCPECEGVGFFCGRSFHPDDPRCQISWDCDNCAGTGEVDATCQCGEPLDEQGWCASCEEFDGEPQCIQCGGPLNEAPCADCNVAASPLDMPVGWHRIGWSRVEL